MTLHLHLFHDTEYGGNGIARSWIEKADELRRGHGWRTKFDRFLALWTAFNAWGMCVSLAHTDAQMLRALKSDRDVNSTFHEVAHQHDFDELIRPVEDSFPLPSFSDLLRLTLGIPGEASAMLSTGERLLLLDGRFASVQHLITRT